MIKNNSYMFLLVGLLLLSACGGGGSSGSGGNNGPANIGEDADPDIVASLPFQARSFDMGTAGYVPAHYPDSSNDDWQAFFDSGAASYGGLFGIHLSPAEDKNENNILDQVKLAYENVKGVTPYIELSINHEAGPFTVERGEEMLAVATANAQKYKPRYFSLGVEINSFYLHQGDTYDLYVSYARQAYDSIKTVSPNTIVMNNFQLDIIKGESDLMGVSYEPQWQLLDDYADKMDAVSFTVYPFLHYTLVSDIPADYLDEIRDHTNLPVLITETGWPTENLLSGVNGSNQYQLDYMLKLAGQANDINVEAIIWVFPHDGDFAIGGGIFNNLSLFDNSGSVKPAYAYWKAINALPKE